MENIQRNISEKQFRRNVLYSTSFLRISAICSALFKYIKNSCPSRTSLRTWCTLISTCLSQTETLSLLASAIAAVLSTYTIVGPDVAISGYGNLFDISQNNRRNHVKSLAQDDRTMYSASAEEKETIFCRLLRQILCDNPIDAKNPVVDCLVFLQPAQSASAKPCSVEEVELPRE